MTKFIVIIALLAGFLSTLIKAFSRLPIFKKRRINEDVFAAPNWYGICENCGKKDALHDFKGKKYCAYCHAKATTEEHFAKRDEQNGS